MRLDTVKEIKAREHRTEVVTHRNEGGVVVRYLPNRMLVIWRMRGGYETIPAELCRFLAPNG